MKRAVIYVPLLSLLFFACKGINKDMLTGTWQAVKLENPEMDSFFTNSQRYIDTVGKGHDAATNMQLYGVANMDSMRKILQQQYDSTKAMQMDAIAHTTFRFRKDGIVELSFNGSFDSSTWYIGKDDTLMLIDLNTEKAKDTARMKITELSGSVLKLKFAENNSSSIVTFHGEGK